jgi:predicted Zn finger-like uncharacterized protein
MSLVTRCPACATTFKVVRDQLRISDGWVRCGRCSEVFDATIDLHETPDAAPTSSTPPPVVADAVPVVKAPPPPADVVDTPAAPSAAAPSLAEDAAQGVAEADFLDDDIEASTPSSFARLVADEPWSDSDASLLRAMDPPMAVRPPPPPPLAFPDIDLTLPAAPPRARETPEPSPGDDTANAQLQKALRRARVKSAKIAKAKARAEKSASFDTQSAPLIAAASDLEPSASDVDRGDPVWSISGEATGTRRSGWRRWLSWFFVLAAALALGVQVVHQERDLILARQPALRPALETLCGVTGCEFSALRQIRDITIDGASFARDKNGDGYRFSFTLRNGATVPLAMPAVELTLLDTQERAVVRRVLLPGDFGAPAILAARADRGASLQLALSGAEVANLPPVAGYRVEAFYP